MDEQGVIHALVEANGWQILTVTQLAAAVDARLRADGSPPTVDRIRALAINTYCTQALHPACAGLRGIPAQHSGFRELARYLHRIAAQKWPLLADDITQETIVVIYQKVADCREPGSFLAFAIQKLRDTAKKLLRANAREYSLDELLEKTEREALAEETSIHEQAVANTETVVVQTELRSQVIERLQLLRQSEKRAARQLEAVWLRHIHELTNEAIALLLETTPENVSVLLNRGFAKLRQDPELQRLAVAIEADDR